MINYQRVFTILFIACLLAMMCVFALNWSTARSSDRGDGCHQFFEIGEDTDGDGIADSATFFEWCNTVHVPLVVHNVGLPTPAPTMSVP